MVDVGALAGRGGLVIREAVAVIQARARHGAPSQLVILPPSYRRRFFGAFAAVAEWRGLPRSARYLVAAVEWEAAVVRRFIRRFDVLPDRLVGQLEDEEAGACDVG